MSKRANPAMIGGFVIGAVMLLAGGAAIFGGAELFAKRNVYVTFFEEETKGLRVGANILMNGVRIGYVSEIAVLVDESNYGTTTRVTLEILPDTYVRTQNGEPIGEGMSDLIDHETLIHEAGLRAQLDIESFVTGQLLIKLALRPDTDPILRGVDTEHPEIPTISSDIAQLFANVENWLSELRSDFDLEAIGARIESLLVGLDELSNSPDVRKLISGLNDIVNDQATQELAGSLLVTLDELQVAIADASHLFQSMDQNIGSLTAETRPALRRLENALHEAEQALQAAKTQLRGDSAQAYQFEATLVELERAARSIVTFFDYLERNPEALLRGKQAR